MKITSGIMDKEKFGCSSPTLKTADSAAEDPLPSKGIRDSMQGNKKKTTKKHS